ncbi:hypothetical protein QET93_007800 [Akkermansia sp. N21116]|uniref:phage tail sheath family protein n=1 Tax=Akkermansia sp. N21116 TaxID=3040764 RepID=UPI00244E8528|nr:hypothetical protein [Akkermansia sp. N21116]WPX39439.1 hypothetical protein QET93_007800 [Akkermansia sp. N21116]
MANTYLHGAYGGIGATQAQSAIQAGTIPVYVGTAPVNLVRGYADSGIINTPVKLSNFTQAQSVCGYSAAWGVYTLCEAMAAHFNNPLGNYGPVYVINVLDPDKHRKSQQETKALSFTNGRAEFISDDIILDTFAIADLAEGVDYDLDYNFTKSSVIVTLKDKTTKSANVTYYSVDATTVKAADIIGSVTAEGEYSGIAALPLLYNLDFKVANLLAAPGWSHLPEVYNALVTAAQKINGHWMAFVVADIPLESVDTIEKAKTWKQTNGYTSEFSKVFWPQAKSATGEIYHLSTLAVWAMQKTDTGNKGIPGETCSNKAVPVICQWFGEDSRNRGFDQETGNGLNEYGISTVVPFNGQLVLWGGHTAAFRFGATSDALYIFDTNIRMLEHIVNSFQTEWMPRIDKPMTIQLRDEIIHRENDKLAGYVAQGFLVGSPECIFLPSENDASDLMNGDFRWNLAATVTPQFKSGTISVSYTDAGLSVYTAED